MCFEVIRGEVGFGAMWTGVGAGSRVFEAMKFEAVVKIETHSTLLTPVRLLGAMETTLQKERKRIKISIKCQNDSNVSYQRPATTTKGTRGRGWEWGEDVIRIILS